MSHDVCVQLPPYADNVALPACAGRAAIDWHLLLAGPTAENLQLQRVCCCGPVLGQTPYR